MKKTIIIPFLLILSFIHITRANDGLIRAAVYKIKSEVLPEEFTETLTDHIESKLLGYSGYHVISRSNLDVLITEDNLSQSGITNDEVRLVKNGSRSAVDKICTGSISRIGKSYSFTLKFIDVSSGRIDASAQEIYNGPAEGLLDIGSALLKQISILGNDDKKNAGTPAPLPSATDSVATDSIKTIVYPVTTSKKEVPPQTTTAIRQVHSTIVNTAGSAPDNAANRPTVTKPSKLGKQISIGAVVIFGTLAALVLLTRTNN